MIVSQEMQELIDEFDRRLLMFPDKSTWQKTNMADWYPFLIDNGPIIIQEFRKMVGILSLIPKDDLERIQYKWAQMCDLIDNDETFQLALKFKKKGISNE